MKPKPFSPLNHFTEPVAIENPLLPWPDLTPCWGSWPVTLSSQRDFQICNGGALKHNNSALRCANGSRSGITRIGPPEGGPDGAWPGRLDTVPSFPRAALPLRHQVLGRRQAVALVDDLGHLLPVGLGGQV